MLIMDYLQLSFDCAAAPGGPLLPRRLVHDGAGNAFLPWCGLLMNAATLEIQVTHLLSFLEEPVS